MTEADLLAAIEANPEDDAPRLAHADWLENHGDPHRAEFIRLQLRDDNRPFWDWGGGDNRAHDLLTAHRERWLDGRPSEKGIDWQFSRGYPERLTFTKPAVYNKTWSRALVPPLHWVTFAYFRDPRQIIDSPGLARIRWLWLDMRRTPDESLPDILQPPHLAELSGLTIEGARGAQRFLALIASLPKLAGLCELALGACGEGEIDPAHVSGLSRLSHLRVLDLWGWRMGNDAARGIWKAGQLHQC